MPLTSGVIPLEITVKLYEKTDSYLKTRVQPAVVISVVAAGVFVLAVLSIKGSGDARFAHLWYGNAIAVIGLLLLEKRHWPIMLVALAVATFAGNVAGGLTCRRARHSSQAIFQPFS
jgi:hypothetical protein